MWVHLYEEFFTIKYIRKIFGDLQQFENTFSFLYFIVRIQYIINETYKICVNQLFMLSVRLLVNSGLLAVEVSWGSKVIHRFSTVWWLQGEDSAYNSHAV